MTAPIVLSARLDTAATEALRSSLMPQLGNSVTLDASGVEHLGARCLELLLRLRQATSDAGRDLTLISPSSAFVADLASLGLTPDDISTGVTS